AEYGLFVMIRFDTFTTAIIDQFQSGYSGPAANMLAMVLVVCCLALLAADAAARGKTRYARLGSGAARTRPLTALGSVLLPCLLIPVITAGLTLGVPLATLGRWLVIGGAGIWKLDEIGGALAETLTLAIAGGALTVAAAIPMAFVSVRAPGLIQRVLEASNYIAGSLPGVVVALALVFITVRVALPLYQTPVTVIAAYVLLFLPRALLSLRASIAQAPVDLEHAAASLGRTPLGALWAVTIRLAAPGAAAGMALVALGITNELTATQLLAPTGTQTLATAFWAYSNEIDYAAAAPYALLMILFALPLTWQLHSQSQRAAGR
ncbi:MAG: iron ABC transporter permease, partial [Acetobacteraceae bacterium]|nr:iron ABC transporter permease [Acetobacteraceae bacterium]